MKNTRINKKGQLLVDPEDLKMLDDALAAYDMALLSQKTAGAPKAIIDFIILKVDEIRRLRGKYFLTNNQRGHTTFTTGGGSSTTFTSL